jgi:maleylpyruvate isomerase
LGIAEDDITGWARTAIEDGLAACDVLIRKRETPFCFGNAPTLADICLVPQLVNARRFGVDLKWDRLLAIEARCLELDAFAKASPQQQPDAE